MIPDQILRLAINRIATLRAPEKRQLEEIVDTETLFCSLTPGLLSQIVGRRVRALAHTGRELLRMAKDDLISLRERGCFFLSQTDSRYPAQLREIYDAPYLLFIRGQLPSDAIPPVAIVGTRAASASASLATERLAAEFVLAGLPVISGLARGIDSAAHTGALCATGGARDAVPTGAILASGVDLITPASNRALARAILADGGFLASEHSPGVPPQKYHFPARNRIISGLSRGVVVAQAPAKSGALITADYALDQGRDLFVLRAGLGGERGAGAAELAADGARIIDGADDVLDEWGVTGLPHHSLVERPRPEHPADAGMAAAATVAAMRRALDEAGV